MTTQPEPPDPTVRATRYEVSVLPEDDVNYRWHLIEILYLGKGLWAVYHRAYDMCLGVDGMWDEGLKEHGRGEAWLAAHRHHLDTARRLAEAAAPHVVANGRLPDGTAVLELCGKHIGPADWQWCVAPPKHSGDCTLSYDPAARAEGSAR